MKRTVIAITLAVTALALLASLVLRSQSIPITMHVAHNGLLTELERTQEDFRNLVTVRGVMADGRSVSVSGTLSGTKHIQKIVEVLGFDIEAFPSEHMAFFRYVDRPGVVGTVGRILGEGEINIAGMQVSRDTRGGHALVVMTVDQAIPGMVLENIIEAIGAEWGRTVDLDG
jgi:D-3-phosphoglycerate dehydrogenase / 2-oxoglutarate reductase